MGDHQVITQEHGDVQKLCVRVVPEVCVQEINIKLEAYVTIEHQEDSGCTLYIVQWLIYVPPGLTLKGSTL